MESQDRVLEAMKKAGTPLSAGQLADLTGLDKKEVEKAMKGLKAAEKIESPIRCKWQACQ